MADNAALSANRRPVRRAKRPKRYTETADFIGMTRRLILAAGRRAGTADMDELVELIALHQAVDEAIAIAIPGVRDNGGYSWTAIGDALGVTRQAARQRYSR